MEQKAYRKRIYHALFAKRFLDRAAWVHCSAHSERAQATQWFIRARAAVIPNPVDLEPFASLDGGALARQELGLAERCDMAPCYSWADFTRRRASSC